MAWTPDGKQLVFAATDPISKHGPESGAQSSRLFVLTDGKKLDVLAESRTHVFSGPAVSPDGKLVACLQILIPRDEAKAEAKPKELTFKADLVIRELPGGREVERIPMPLRHRITATQPDDDDENTEPNELVGSLGNAARLAFSADGKQVYVSDVDALYRVDRASGKREELQADVAAFSVSPDGGWLAAVGENSVTFRRIKGEPATVGRKVDGASPIAAPCWLDDKSVAVLVENRMTRVSLADEQATVLFDVKMSSEKNDKGDPAEVARQPNGGRWVIVTGNGLLVLSPDGKQIKPIENKERELLDSPAYRPDGKAFAVKRLVGKEDLMRAAEIILFDPDGKELSRVEIPPAATTQP